MSSEQATLSDVVRSSGSAHGRADENASDGPAGGAGSESAAWAPSEDGGRGKWCRRCGGHVTPDFVRVFGSEETGEVYACVDCVSHAALRDGAGADPEHNWRHDS